MRADLLWYHPRTLPDKVERSKQQGHRLSVDPGPGAFLNEPSERSMPLLLFIALLPVIEIALFIEIGGAIGLAATLLWVVLSALIGVQLIRYQGLATMARVQAAMETGGVPVEELSGGLCVIAAGVLLIVPGFFTDAIALLLLIAPLRRTLGGLVWRAVDAGRQRGGGDLRRWQFSARRSEGRKGSPLRGRTVVDVDYEDVPPRDGGSGNS
jgi:UPF0716 protein FxsA